MPADFQTLAALATVLLAAAFLVRRVVSRRRQPGCGGAGECACPTPTFKPVKREATPPARDSRRGRDRLSAPTTPPQR